MKSSEALIPSYGSIPATVIIKDLPDGSVVGNDVFSLVYAAVVQSDMFN